MGPRRATPPQRAPSSKVSTPSEPPTPKKEVFNGLFGGLDLTFDGGPKFGPDGEPLEHNATGLEHTFGQPNAEVGDMEHTFGKREKVELKTTAWYHADSGRQQLEYAAQRDLQAICETVEEMKARGRCLTGKFTNDPEIIPDRKFPEVLPFPPEMAQLMLRRQLDEDVEDEDLEEPTFPGYTAWHRLSEFQPLAGGTARVFQEGNLSHLGRVFPGHLENMYLVEALNAVSLRPKLARQLFLCFDQERAVYILSLFKNGIWMKVEVDDYVPVVGGEPLCCRSEKFPHVLWPSLVEKAYAKVSTLRDPLRLEENSGGWLAVGGGGCAEDALVDLTGGVAGRFYTADVSPDRLFLYIYTLQSDTLFVCHVNDAKCARTGVSLNPCASHVINRAATFDGRCFVQIFSADVSGVHDGGLSDAVPLELWRDYPEKGWEGFFWLTIEDFHAYFETIIECRLTSSPDVSIQGMPGRLPKGLPYMETLFANPGRVIAQYPPEITVTTRGPCEVIVATMQMDSRITQVGSERQPYIPLIMKVYESLGNNMYSAHMVCRSNWIPTRDAMVAFQTAAGGVFKVIVEMPEHSGCDRLVIRCYSTSPADFMVNPAMAKHVLALPQAPPVASRLSLVGTVDPARLLRDDVPEPMSDDLDTIRRRHNAVHRSCVMM
ncbi:unnamed protein product [Cladocopium goreaui]|uniref:Calpain-5 (New calpain 3) (NCL-3) n=1 Tax=Cladocopium goreaui TaxID=2562237 RepID=A0A9P1M4W5_9DINO|nr:unnamed protein product [Cladocopium goreaui]